MQPVLRTTFSDEVRIVYVLFNDVSFPQCQAQRRPSPDNCQDLNERSIRYCWCVEDEYSGQLWESRDLKDKSI